MPKSFASDKHALGECARCGVKMLLKFMVNDGYYPNLIVCPTCWEPRHPQESLPNVEDPTTLYRPAPENLPAATVPVLSHVLQGALHSRNALLQWTASTDEASMIKQYDVYKSTNVLETDPSYETSFSLYRTVTVLRAYDTTITNNPLQTLEVDITNIDLDTSFYHYYVMAVPWQGPQAKSNIDPLDEPPTAPVLSGSWNPATNTETLTWTASTSFVVGASNYEIYRNVDGGAFTLIHTQSTSAPRTYDDVGLTRLVHAYSYKVRVVDIIGGFADSNILLLPKLSYVYIAIADAVSLAGTDQSISYSIDFGTTWVATNTPGANTPLVAMAQSVPRGEILALHTAGILLRSIDGGLTWANLANNMGNSGWQDMIRIEPLGIYVAVGNGGAISTSPDGVTWTARTSGVGNNIARVMYNTVTGVIVAGLNAFNTKPWIISTDAFNWAAPAVGFGVSVFVNRLTFSTVTGRWFFGSNGDVHSAHTDDPNNGPYTIDALDFTGTAGCCYYAPANFFVGCNGIGIMSGSASGAGQLSYPYRATTQIFQNAFDINSAPGTGKVICCRSLSGAETLHHFIQSTDGIVFTQIVPGWAIASRWARIYEFLREVP